MEMGMYLHMVARCAKGRSFYAPLSFTRRCHRLGPLIRGQ